MASLDILRIDQIGAPIPPLGAPPYEMWIDEAQRIARTEAHGYWTLAETEDYIAELAGLVDDCRCRFGRARVLVDRRGMCVQDEAVADRLGVANGTLFGELDRLALVVDSSLAKVQMRRRFVHAGSQAFLSYTAAELWLTAWP